MDVEIIYRPSYSLGVIKLAGQECVRVEAGALVGMSDGMTLESQATGGILKSLKRHMFTGESFFQNIYIAPSEGGEVCVAPALPGDMIVLDLNSENLLMQSGAYIASDLDIELDAKWGGAKTFFASEGIIMLAAGGTGKLLLASYGAIHEVNLGPGERYTVDTGHLVAFSEHIGFKVRFIGGLRTSLTSKEGLVVDLTGPGRVLMQTRSSDAFVRWLRPKVRESRER